MKPYGQTRRRKPSLYVVVFVLGVIILGCLARFWAATKGHNFDMDSYRIVAAITDQHGNVYAQTARYNYGPVWFTILHGFSHIAHLFEDSGRVFRLEIIGLLTLADLTIAAILWRKFGRLAAILFFLNPVSIAVTGFHNQFDNLAIALALLAVLFLERAEKSLAVRPILIGGVLLGLSLMTKHLFFLLPFWLAWRQQGWYRKLLVLIIPIGLFLASFIPFWSQGHAGIVHNVFLYRSFNDAPFFYFILPKFLQLIVTPQSLFLGSLILAGYVTRKMALMRAALWYLVVLVLFSPAIANQYFAIVMPAVAAFATWAFIPFVYLATVLLWVTSSVGIQSQKVGVLIPRHVQALVSEAGGLTHEYEWIIAMLFLGVVYYAQRHTIKKYCQRVFETLVVELRDQISDLRSH